MLHVEKYESYNVQMLTAVSSLVNSINMELCEHSCGVPQSDSIRRFYTANAQLLDRHVYDKHGMWFDPALLTARACSPHSDGHQL
jgi:hypothetical protein